MGSKILDDDYWDANMGAMLDRLLLDKDTPAELELKTRKVPNFTITVVENGYIISYDKEQYIYSSVDDIVDTFVNKIIHKPAIKFD